jgi:multimeric flavodoxin WrbA
MVVDQEQLEQMVKEMAEMVQEETAETELLLLEDKPLIQVQLQAQ